MSVKAIQVTQLSKQYRIGQGERYKALRDTLAAGLAAPWHGLQGMLRGNQPGGQNGANAFIWALKDVTFNIEHGEAIGIIGRNGAGKSTLLKILSRITEPTVGSVDLYGRVGSLLEVGTGFHPELTGRENISLNGAILGMRRAEIERKFDEIVAFAEIEKFIDTPVKFYSSGMYMRLAFSVAAHLEPDILLVDEVLAVGDAAFQKKCLGKMGDVARKGRTVLFVSHNMQAIRQLCQRAVLLDEGRLVLDGPASEVTDSYLKSIPMAKDAASLEAMIRQLPPDPAFQLENICLTQNGQPVGDRVLNGQTLEIEMHYHVLERTTGLRVFFDLVDNEENLLFRSFHDEDQDGIPVMEPGRYESRAVIPADLLAPIPYEIRIYATVFNVRMCIPGLGIRIPINVERTGKANRAYLIEPIRGRLALAIPWQTKHIGG